MSDAPEPRAPVARYVIPLAAAVLGVLGTAWLATLLWRPFTVGMSQSYDTALYARSMWGVAHGEALNPVYGTHWLGVHANGVLWLTAPLTRWMAAWKVLVLTQSLAFGATLALLFVAAQRAVAPLLRTADDGTISARTWIVLTGAWTWVALAGAPLLINPFFFDARPDLVAVPLLLAGLLRVLWRGGWDARAFLWLVAASMVREEFAAIAAASLMLTPPAQRLAPGAAETLPPRVWSIPKRALGAAVLGGWFCAYWWGVRPALLDGAASARALQAAGDLFSSGGPSVGAFRGALAVAVVTFGGGFALRGWRWLGPAIPGLLFVALSSKMADQALNFHYPMFAAPALAVAAIAGLRAFAERAATHGAHRRMAVPALVGASVVAVVVSAAFGAHPLGARFKAEYFAADPSAQPWQAECHALLDQIPEEEGTAVVSMFGAPFSDRAAAWSLETLLARLREGGDVPPDVNWIAVENTRFGSLGRVLVNAHGFRLYGIAAGRLALFQRAESASSPPPILGTGVPLAPCVSQEIHWAAAGITLCDIQRLPDDRIAAVAIRLAPRGAADRPLALHAEVNGTGTQLTALGGLIDLSTLAVGQGVQVVSADRILAPRARFHLSDMDGRAFEGRGTGSAERGLGVDRALPAAVVDRLPTP